MNTWETKCRFLETSSNGLKMFLCKKIVRAEWIWQKPPKYLLLDISSFLQLQS
uniref:Uncharacterized protein n=2 Tax=Arundo donax TaxID=35708 RepID=A0A0A9CVL4_ARUDO